jgi:hypothetical protein
MSRGDLNNRRIEFMCRFVPYSSTVLARFLVLLDQWTERSVSKIRFFLGGLSVYPYPKLKMGSEVDEKVKQNS